MKPPHCFVCTRSLDDIPKDDDLDDHFTLVYFATDGPLPHEQQLGWTGHPHNAVWFCSEHAPLAEDRRHLSVFQALAEIDMIVKAEP